MKLALPVTAIVLTAVVAAGPLEERAKCGKYAQAIPKCAVGPIGQCAKKSGCFARQFKCICSNLYRDTIIACAKPKLVKKCSKDDYNKYLSAFDALCTCAVG